MRKQGKVFIGTSGWVYSHWEDIFYPKGLDSKEKLKYFSRYFKTAEINYSFYHLPRPQTYKSWYNLTVPNFIFSVKVSRFITHIKRLKEVEKEWQVFLERAFILKEKLGPFLLQFPPSFKFSKETLSLFERFLFFTEKLKKRGLRKDIEGFNSGKNKERVRLAVEIRDSSFENKQFFNLLNKFNTALVISNSPRWKEIRKTDLADFCYLRMHGSKVLFSSKYTRKEIQALREDIKKWQKEGKDVYVYFNNDFQAAAIENAKQLLSFFDKS